MIYPTYCKICDAITGHQIHRLSSECMKCHTVTTTPVIRWVAGLLAIGGISFLIFWISLSLFFAAFGAH